MDRQAVFSKAITGIIKQNALSKINDCEGEKRCVYFDPATQNRCAVGHLLTKSQAQTLEKTCKEQSAGAAVKAFPKFFAKYNLNLGTEGDKNFLNRLQLLHDHSTDIPDFVERAKRFASNNIWDFPT